MSTADLSTQSLLALGALSRQASGSVQADARWLLSPDPFADPTPESPGWSVGASNAAYLDIAIREDIRHETAYLVIDPNGALAGDYSFTGGGDGPGTHTAAGGDTAAEVLEAWAADILTELPAFVLAADVVAFRESGGAKDAIRLRMLAGLETGRITAASGPAGAQLRIVREPSSVSATVYLRRTVDPTGEIVHSTGTRAQRDAWRQPLGGSLGDVYRGGLLHPLPTGDAHSAYVRLVPTYPDSILTVVTSGDGIYGVHPLATVSIDPTVTR